MRFRLTLIGMVALGAAMLTGTAASAADVAVEAPIKAFGAAFNKGDMAGAAATMAPDVVIIDEVAPFRWTGTDALTAWLGDLDADAKRNGITEPAVQIGAPVRELIEGGHAYVIAPATYRYTEKGVKMIKVSKMTFSLVQGGAGWKISGWTWTGPNGSRAR